MEWYNKLPHTCTVHQFGINLLRRILAADVERFYEQAISDVRHEVHSPFILNDNPNDLVAIHHWFKNDHIVPDAQHILELSHQTKIHSIALTDLADQIKDIAEASRRTSLWTEDLYTKGAKPQQLSHTAHGEINQIMMELDLHQTIIPSTPVTQTTERFKNVGQSLIPQQNLY
jgi:hypothetical protein